MATEIVMPRLSDSMEEGTIVAWLKSVGDKIAVGGELVEIETDKATMVYEADAAGTLIEVLAREGETLAIGTVIARVEAEAGGGTAGDAQTSRSEMQAQDEPQPAPGRAPSTGTRIKASPLARRVAGKAGVELAAISGTGPGGRIVKADVERMLAAGSTPAAAPPLSAAQASASSPPHAIDAAKGAVEVQEPDRLQATVARRMAEAKATVPHFYLEAEVEMTRCLEARERLKARAAEGEAIPSFNDMAIKACALALKEFPRANGAYRDGRWELYERINIGVAVAAPGALVVPTVFDADRKGLGEIALETRKLAERVRAQRITPPELSGATFTVSNLGMFGVRNFHPVINLPQAAILAMGEINRRPALDDRGDVIASHVMAVSLACDHRILYGAEAAEFLARARSLLSEPLGLAL